MENMFLCMRIEIWALAIFFHLYEYFVLNLYDDRL